MWTTRPRKRRAIPPMTREPRAAPRCGSTMPLRCTAHARRRLEPHACGDEALGSLAASSELWWVVESGARKRWGATLRYTSTRLQ